MALGSNGAIYIAMFMAMVLLDPALGMRTRVAMTKLQSNKVHAAESHEVKSVTCTAFQPREVQEQCNNRNTVVKLGKMPDRYACAEACRDMAVKSEKQVCCVFTYGETCYAYPEAGPIVGKEVGKAKGKGVSVRGSAVLCSPPSFLQSMRTGLYNAVFGETDTTDEAAASVRVAETNVSAVRSMVNAQEVALFRTVDPQEIMQGGLGDCWLMAAIAGLARYPAAVQKLFGQQVRSQDGTYQIQLYDTQGGSWVWVSVDKSVPAGSSKPIYAQLAKDRAGWVLLLEKAAAKLSPQQRADVDEQGYGNLIGGFPELAMAMFSGNINTRSFTFQGGQITMSAMTWRSDSGPGSGSQIPVSADRLWRELLLGSSDSRLMAGSINQADAAATRETRLSNGLYGGHAYSVLQARLFDPAQPASTCFAEVEVAYTSLKDMMYDAGQMQTVRWDPRGPKRFSGGSWEKSRAIRYGVGLGWTLVDQESFVPKGSGVLNLQKVIFRGVVEAGVCSSSSSSQYHRAEWQDMSVSSLEEPLRLVQVRNPWGNDKLYKGPWSDGDRSNWRLHPDVAMAAGFMPLPDGMWWMTLEDLVKSFTRISVGEVNMHKLSPGSMFSWRD